MNNYIVEIITTNDSSIEFVNLTKKEASKLYELLMAHSMGDIKEYRWYKNV